MKLLSNQRRKQMDNQFYLFTDGDKFVRVKNLKISLVASIDKAAYWTSKKSAKTWERFIIGKYPNLKLVEGRLNLK